MPPSVALIPCPGCGAILPEEQGPVHAYIESSPACWRLFGAVLAREYASRECWTVHALTVDTYAVQHPGRPSPRAVRSVCAHLLSLCQALEHGVPTGPDVMRDALRRSDGFRWLGPPDRMPLTVVDVAPVSSPAEHVHVVRAWAESTWNAWAPHHATLRTWLTGR